MNAFFGFFICFVIFFALFLFLKPVRKHFFKLVIGSTIVLFILFQKSDIVKDREGNMYSVKERDEKGRIIKMEKLPPLTRPIQ